MVEGKWFKIGSKFWIQKPYLLNMLTKFQLRGHNYGNDLALSLSVSLGVASSLAENSRKPAASR